ncbi:MAG: hypothetical protein ABR905_07830 [Terracidiphilus sp.]|jgi:hypothetical protein
MGVFDTLVIIGFDVDGFAQEVLERNPLVFGLTADNGATPVLVQIV